MTVKDFLFLASAAISLGVIFDQFMIRELETKTIKLKIIEMWVAIQSVELLASIHKIQCCFLLVFDAAYGKKHLSLKCFVRSCLSSILFSALLLPILTYYGFFWTFKYPETSNPYFSVYVSWFSYLVDAVIDPFLYQDFSLTGALFLSLLLDYFSLLETRFLLRSKKESINGMILLLIIDIVFSLTIYMLPIFIIYVGVAGGEVSDFIDIIIPGGHGRKEFLTPFTYASICTSFIFHAFIIVSLFMRLMFKLKLPAVYLLEWMETTTRPTTAILSVLAAIVGGTIALRNFFS